MPSKRKVTGRKNNSLELKKREKHQAFLKDFDLEVDRRKREMEKALNSLLIQLDANYSRAIMKLPLAVRQMNNLHYFALGGSADAVAEIEQKRINADCLEVEAIESEILKDATQLKTTRKRKQKTKRVDDAANDGENYFLHQVKCSERPSKVLPPRLKVDLPHHLPPMAGLEGQVGSKGRALQILLIFGDPHH
ncbi:borealin-like [Amblyraja radiata]|uniref:borealin-like n=1 Tax=Amblyraja radiata TaxID=386614 RepID=UPI001402EFA7|nr:borealin-like [Amblyraja radiata]